MAGLRIPSFRIFNYPPLPSRPPPAIGLFWRPQCTCAHTSQPPRERRSRAAALTTASLFGGGGAIQPSQNTLSCLRARGRQCGGEQPACGLHDVLSVPRTGETKSQSPGKSAAGLAFKFRCPNHRAVSVSTPRHHSTNIYLPPGLRAQGGQVGTASGPTGAEAEKKDR